METSKTNDKQIIVSGSGFIQFLSPFWGFVMKNVYTHMHAPTHRSDTFYELWAPLNQMQQKENDWLQLKTKSRWLMV